MVFLSNQLASRLRERREHKVFQQLLQMVPSLEERLLDGSDVNIRHIAELVRVFLLAVLTLADVSFL
jgi:hypothetical protein